MPIVWIVQPTTHSFFVVGKSGSFQLGIQRHRNGRYTFELSPTIEAGVLIELGTIRFYDLLDILNRLNRNFIGVGVVAPHPDDTQIIVAVEENRIVHIKKRSGHGNGRPAIHSD